MSAQHAIPVFTAGTGSPWEAELVARLQRAGGAVHVVRRCVDLADLLAVAATGTGRAALLAADLRRLDRDALARLAGAGVAPVGVVAPGDEPGRTRLRLLGVRHVLDADAAPEAVVAAVLAAVRSGWDGEGGVEHAYADPLAALPDLPEQPGAGEVATGSTGESATGSTGESATGSTGESATGSTGEAATGLASTGGTTAGVGVAGATRQPAGKRNDPGDPVAEGPPAAAPAPVGRLVAVWGPTGAPGRTTVAVGLAAEIAAAGTSTLLADADVYGGVVAQVLGLLDEAPGLAAAVRLANTGGLDLDALARIAPVVSPRLRVLTGLSRPDRWPELHPAALGPVWTMARRLARVTLVDCGFALEQEEELSFDTAAPRRNGATLATLASADLVLAVGAADPVGLSRLVRGLADLREAVPGATVQVVLNQVRRGPVGADPQRQLSSALARYAGVQEVRFLPYDRAGLDAALLVGRSLAEAVPGSSVRKALASLAAELLDQPPRRSRRRSLVRRPAFG